MADLCDSGVTAVAMWITGLILICCGVYRCEAATDPMPQRPLLNYEVTDQVDPSEGRLLQLPCNISFLGSRYDQLYISADGTVSFGDVAVDFVENAEFVEGAGEQPTNIPFIAPFYYRSSRSKVLGSIYVDVIEKETFNISDTQYQLYATLLDYLEPYMRDSVLDPPADFEAKLVVLVTWNNVGDASEDPQCQFSCQSATFQLVIVADENSTYAIFNYLKLDVKANKLYRAGLNGGPLHGWVNVIPCLAECDHPMQQSLIGRLNGLVGSDLAGRFILDVGGDRVVRGGCLTNEVQVGTIEVSPTTVGMFGGERLTISGLCLPYGTSISCRFTSLLTTNSSQADALVTTGKVMRNGLGYCAVPMMTFEGQAHLLWSSPDQKFTFSTVVTVVSPAVLEEPVSIPPEVRSNWANRYAQIITIPWDPQLFSNHSNAKVDLKLIGYREVKGDNQTAPYIEFKELTRFGTIPVDVGSHTFQVENYRCKQNCEGFQLGLLEVGMREQYQDYANSRVAIRYGPFPLGWYLNEAMDEQRGFGWPNKKCRQWKSEDARDTEWVASLLPCPCNLDQALADFGRWQTDPECNAYTRSECRYHKGAKHCVYSVMATPEGAGNQCCYRSDGTLMYSQLSYQGSSPDRSHLFGSAPYSLPGRVPVLSHWSQDLVHFYHCCPWSGSALCSLYEQQRSTVDCVNYTVPDFGFVRGDPHITTFDGQSYHIDGEGDFWLVRSLMAEKQLQIQGRFAARPQSWDLGQLLGKKSWKAKALTALAIQCDAEMKVTMVIHARPTTSPVEGRTVIRVSRNGRPMLFDHTAERKRVYDCVITAHVPGQAHNLTIVHTGHGVGLNVVAFNGLLHVTMAVPPSMKEGAQSQLVGLMGTYDGNPDNDFQTSKGALVSPSDKRQLYQAFTKSWQVYNTDESLFMDHKPAEDLDPDNSYFELEDIPTTFPGAPSSESLAQTCGDDDRCKWDFLVTGDIQVAMATRDANVAFLHIQSVAQTVDTCGMLDMDEQVTLSSYDFSVGQEVMVIECSPGTSASKDVIFRCVKEEIGANSSIDYGIRRFDPINNTEYVLRWDPKPYSVCMEVAKAPFNVGQMLAIGVGIASIILAVVLVALLVCCIRKKFKRRSVRYSVERESGSNPPDRRSKQALLGDSKGGGKDRMLMSDLDSSDI